MLDLVVSGMIIISRQWLLSYRYANMQWDSGQPQSWVIVHLCTAHKDCPFGAIYFSTTDIDAYAETLKFLRFYGHSLDKLNLVVNRRTKTIMGYRYGMDVQWVFEHSLSFVPRRSKIYCLTGNLLQFQNLSQMDIYQYGKGYAWKNMVNAARRIFFCQRFVNWIIFLQYYIIL